MSSTPEQSKRWRQRYPEKVRAYRSTDAYRERQNERRRQYLIDYLRLCGPIGHDSRDLYVEKPHLFKC